MSESYLMRFREAAQFLAVSERTLYRLVEDGSIPVVRLRDKQRGTVRFRRADLIEYADQRAS